MPNPRLLVTSRNMAIELKAWRALHGYTQHVAAAKLGIPLRDLVEWENGTPVPFPSMVAAAIGVPLGPRLFQ